MKHCPVCKHEVGSYHELPYKEPYTHNMPFDGLMIYGAFSAPKETLCYEDNFLHFAFYDAENNLTDHRLVQLDVENPTTISPSDQYMEDMMMADEALNDDGSSIDYENANEVVDLSDEDDLPF